MTIIIQANPGFYWVDECVKNLEEFNSSKEPIIGWIIDKANDYDAPIPITTYGQRRVGVIVEPDGSVRDGRERDGCSPSVEEWFNSNG
jgi:hypothetical protein